MTPEKLQLAKDELKKFYLLLCPFVEYFKSGLPHYQMIEVLIQHAQFNALGCQGYDHKAEVKKLYEIQKLLYLLKTHYGSYFESWVSEEVDTVIMFAIHSDD
jgi:hypothetical protein